MIRKSGIHFCDKIMLKLLIWRMFLSMRWSHLIGTCASAFRLLDPDAQDLFVAVRQDAKCDVDRLVANEAFVADLDADGIEKDQGIDRIQRAVLPFGHLLENGVDHGRYEVGRHFDAVNLFQMRSDLPDRQPPRM